MAEIQNSFFYDGNQQYGEDELGVVFDTCFRSGVRVDDNGTLCYKVSAGSGAVSVEPGEALVGGRWRYDASSQTLKITAAASNKRRDRVVIRTDYANKQTIVTIKQGTASSNPQAPSLQRDSSIYEISLATIQVTPAGAVTIVSDDRTNESLCGVVRPRYNTQLNQMIRDFQSYINTVKAQFESWFAQQQAAKGWRQVFIQDEEPGPEEVTAGALWFDSSPGNRGLILRVADAEGSFLNSGYNFFNYSDIIIDYRVHEKNNGWTDVVESCSVAGTTGQSRRIEAIQIGSHRRYFKAPAHHDDAGDYITADRPLHR